MGTHIDYHWGNLSSMAQFKILSTHAAAIVDNAYSEQLPICVCTHCNPILIAPRADAQTAAAALLNLSRPFCQVILFFYYYQPF